MDVNTLDAVKITDSGSDDNNPEWSPDSSKLTFIRQTGGYSGALLIVNADGTNARVLARNTGSAATGLWSPDGSKIAFTSY